MLQAGRLQLISRFRSFHEYGGRISPAQRLVSHGETTTFTHIPASEWKLAAVADCNGNGLSDTLWMHIPGRTLVVALTGEHLFDEVGALYVLPEQWEMIE